jgi:predicted nucleic acid-binding protein
MPPPLVDTSVLLRHFTGDNVDHSPRANALVARIAAEEVVVRVTDQVIFEAAFTLERTYKISKTEIRDALVDFIDLPAVLLPGKQLWPNIFDVYARTSLSIVDAYHAVTMLRLGITEIISFDRDFDRIPGITRIEP